MIGLLRAGSLVLGARQHLGALGIVTGRRVAVDTEPPVTYQIGLLENRPIRAEERDFLATLANMKNLQECNYRNEIFVYILYIGFKYLAICLQVGKVPVAVFATIEHGLRDASQHREIDTRSSDHSLVDLVVAVVEGIRSASLLQVVLVPNLLRGQLFFNVNGVLRSASLLGQRLGRGANDLRHPRVTKKRRFKVRLFILFEGL